jgi:glucose uptake protein GlcU
MQVGKHTNTNPIDMIAMIILALASALFSILGMYVYWKGWLCCCPSLFGMVFGGGVLLALSQDKVERHKFHIFLALLAITGIVLACLYFILFMGQPMNGLFSLLPIRHHI